MEDPTQLEDSTIAYNHTSNGGSGDRTNNAQVGRITIKPPTFYRSNPQVWFRQLESQFALANITSSQTKFHHVMGALPEDVAINLPLDVTSYESLKEQIIGIYQKSRQELLEEALGSISLDGQKPSVCFLRIKRKLEDCHLTVDDQFLRHKFLQALLPTTRVALSAHHNLALDDFAKLADTIYQYSTFDYHVAAVRPDPKPEHDSVSPNRNFQHDPRQQKGGMFPFSAGQKPKICRFHVFYANNAKRCKPWCKWPGQKPQLIDASSRPATPNNPASN